MCLYIESKLEEKNLSYREGSFNKYLSSIFFKKSIHQAYIHYVTQSIHWIQMLYNFHLINISFYYLYYTKVRI